LHLKRMELFGFKSFADKSELGLLPGIAAVIGPNGCGKSNLVDAVRWALGEQSVKSLRGNKMEEIIFSGSENRKALNFAEVSLTFDGAGNFLNLDYDEITITRRLFRNGDSEYYINKSPCRLKDITEMFMDTGLGKDVYSVIGQGRVDEIINSRPEERRELFEEAAGIFKYKLRKKEARRRLEETRENLIRVQDLIFELDNQVEPLQEQAQVTRQYRDLQQQVEAEEKRLLSFQLRKTQADLEKVDRQLQSVNDALLSAAAQGGQREKELQDLKNRLFDQLQLKKEKESEYSNLVRIQEQHQSEIKLLVERENRYREKIEEDRQNITKLKQLSSEYAGQIAQAGQNLDLKKTELDGLEEDLRISRENLSLHEKSPLAHEAEKMQEMIYKASARREAAEMSLTENRRRLEKVREQKEQIMFDLGRLSEDDAEQGKVIEDMRLKIEDAKKQLLVLKEKETSEKQKEEQYKEKLNNAVAEANSLKEKVSSIRSRLQLLEEQDLSLTGYYRGVKEIMQARLQLPGIIGPVADLIEVETPYVQAVESALGSSLQYLVAESEKAVRQAILFLKEAKKGWATFLPLDILHQPAEPMERFPGWQNQEGVIGKASELVKTDSAYRKAINYLLSPTMVCRTLDDALKAARFVKHSCRIVTLEGEMINQGGIIRGGSLPTRNAGMPLGRRKEIDDLKRELDTLNIDLQEAENKVESLIKCLNDQKQNVVNLLNQNREISDRYVLVTRDFEKAQLEQTTIRQRLESLRVLQTNTKEEENELQKRDQELRFEIEQSGLEITRGEKDLAAIKEDYRKYLQKKETLEQAVTNALISISKCREQHEGLLERINDLNLLQQKPATELVSRESSLKKDQQELQDNEEAKRNLKQKLEELDAQKGELMIELDRLSNQAGVLEAELIEYEEQGRLEQSRIVRQEKRERQLSMDQTRLQTELNYQEMHFKELFNSLELVDTAEEYNPETSREKIENLREDVEALGEVNLGAIEELSRLEERIKFLTDQKEDLHRGEKSLHKVLAEIDERMEYYFLGAFEQINKNFSLTFNELFEGGQVLLKLTDDENILESGVEIIAQPPGKKLQNITLLSAGEKVLTAIALVFAILRYKPAPFYLMDEVESTLDDANLSRFTKFLKQNSKQAQFIMITHRRRTMEEAGILYGVTMPEAGVSRLMSLKLEDCAVGGEQ
jgi:chromosome segregation protein